MFFLGCLLTLQLRNTGLGMDLCRSAQIVCPPQNRGNTFCPTTFGQRLIGTNSGEDGILAFLLLSLRNVHTFIQYTHRKACLFVGWWTLHDVISIIEQHGSVGMPHKGERNPVEIAFCIEDCVPWECCIRSLCVFQTDLA